MRAHEAGLRAACPGDHAIDRLSYLGRMIPPLRGSRRAWVSQNSQATKDARAAFADFCAVTADCSRKLNGMKSGIYWDTDSLKNPLSLPNVTTPAFTWLVRASAQFAIQAAFELKDALRARGHKWNGENTVNLARDQRADGGQE
jgi:hypothetical protein